MGTWWWLALGAVAALSLVAAVIDGGGRLGRRRRATPLPHAGPCPGEIWWTREPLLVLVLAVRSDAARVARVAAELPSGEGESENAAEADIRGRIDLPPGTVRDAPGKVTALRTDETRDVALDVFETRAGEVDPATWDRVRHLAGG
jgi:hypothetical protein